MGQGNITGILHNRIYPHCHSEAHNITHSGRSDFIMMSQHKHVLYQGWMCWSHTQTKRHNNRPIMSCV